MQETHDQNGAIYQEFFSGASDEEAKEKMDKRLKELQAEGHILSKRVKIGRNEACPCGSGKKFKKCCLGKVQ